MIQTHTVQQVEMPKFGVRELFLFIINIRGNFERQVRERNEGHTHTHTERERDAAGLCTDRGCDLN